MLARWLVVETFISLYKSMCIKRSPQCTRSVLGSLIEICYSWHTPKFNSVVENKTNAIIETSWADFYLSGLSWTVVLWRTEDSLLALSALWEWPLSSTVFVPLPDDSREVYSSSLLYDREDGGETGTRASTAEQAAETVRKLCVTKGLHYEVSFSTVHPAELCIVPVQQASQSSIKHVIIDNNQRTEGTLLFWSNSKNTDERMQIQLKTWTNVLRGAKKGTSAINWYMYIRILNRGSGTV